MKIIAPHTDLIAIIRNIEREQDGRIRAVDLEFGRVLAIAVPNPYNRPDPSSDSDYEAKYFIDGRGWLHAQSDPEASAIATPQELKPFLLRNARSYPKLYFGGDWFDEVARELGEDFANEIALITEAATEQQPE